MADSGTRFGHIADAGLADISMTVGTLPAGYNLGQERIVDGVQYRLVYNAGGSAIPPGMCAAVASGLYSVTVSTAAQLFQEIGGVINNTAASVATNVYFWGARKGPITSGLVASAACIPTGSAFYVGGNGNVILLPQSIVTGVAPCGIAATTILSTTSGGGRNGSAHLDMR